MSPPSRNRHAITFVFITVFLDRVGFGLVMPVLPRLIEQVSGTDLAGASLLGNLSDAYGRRPILLLSVFGLAVDYLLTAYAPNMWWLFVGRTFAGLCGASYTTANAYLADITKPEDRAKAFGLMGAAFGLGFIIGPAIGGILGEYGPRVPFFVAAGYGLATGLSMVFILFVTMPPKASPSLR